MVSEKEEPKYTLSSMLMNLFPRWQHNLCFDKGGYNDYKAFKLFCEEGTGFATCIKDNAVHKVDEELYIDECIHSGVLDTIIYITVIEESGESKLKLRKVVFYDMVLKRKFEFLTNLFEMHSDVIAAIYKIRW